MTSRSPNCGPRCSCRLIGEGRCSRLGATAPDLRSGGRFLASAQSGQARFCARFTKTPASVQTARRGRRPEGLPPAASTSGRSRLFLRRRPAKKARTPQSSSRKIFSDLSFEERAKEDREAKIVGKPPRTSLNDHKRLRCFARSFRALGVRQLLRPTFSHRGIKQAYGLPKNPIQSVRGCG